VNRTGKVALLVVAFAFAIIPLSSQTTSQTTHPNHHSKWFPSSQAPRISAYVVEVRAVIG